jgi:hypothetical protein
MVVVMIIMMMMVVVEVMMTINLRLSGRYSYEGTFAWAMQIGFGDYDIDKSDLYTFQLTDLYAGAHNETFQIRVRP